MKAAIYKAEGYKLMGAAFEVYNEQGYGLAERPRPGGLPDISRGLSASDTPGTRPEKEPHPGGVRKICLSGYREIRRCALRPPASFWQPSGLRRA